MKNENIIAPTKDFMEAQTEWVTPNPTSSEHEFRLSRRHIGECEVCGRPAAAHPKPTTGEWTPYWLAHFGKADNWLESICDAHNASLAAKDEFAAKWKLTLEFVHEKELAAEREKVEFRDKVIKQHKDALHRQEQQLSAERERTRHFEYQMDLRIKDVKQLRSQLDAERENIVVEVNAGLVKELNEAKKQLEFEREKHLKDLEAISELRELDQKDITQLRSQQQPLVDALEQVRPACWPNGWKIIDAALAKVKEGK